MTLKFYCSSLSIGLLISVVFTSGLKAEQISLSGILFGSDSPYIFNPGPTNNPVSFSRSGSYASTAGSASYGRVSLHLTGAATTTKSGFATAGGYWTDTITITPDNPALLGTAGTLLVTLHLEGSQAASNLHNYPTTDQVIYDIYTDGYTFYEGQYSGYLGGFGGTPMGDLASFTWPHIITLGSPLAIDTRLSGKIDIHAANPTPPTGSLHATLTQGSFTVLDNNGNPISFSATSSVGAVRTKTVSTGSNFAGFGLTNNLGLHTSFALLDGNAGSTTTNLAAAFVPNPATNAVLASDPFDLDGPSTNRFAVSASFDPAALTSGASALEMVLLYLQPATKTWVNAVTGNSDNGAAARAFVGAFNSLVHTNLGDYGVDPTNRTAWAVVNHNSVFAVGKLIVPPVLHWAGLTFGTNGPILTLSGGTGNAAYIVEANSDLSTTNWTMLGSVTLNTNGAGLFTDTNGLTQRRFYRAHP